MEYLFQSRDVYFKSPFGAVQSGSDVVFRAGIERKLLIKEVYLRLKCEGGQDYTIKGSWADLKMGYDIYRFDWPCDEIGLYTYYFETHFEDDGWDSGISYQLSVFMRGFKTPDWLKSGVMYQIFPDRFARSPNYIAPSLSKDYRLREDWGGIPEYRPNDQGLITNNDFFGGNLLGIISKLSYLKDLGITVIYLNPIVEAHSNHRYDTGDFKKVDPILGTLADFRNLCIESKKMGIRIILDGVFNHTGSDSLYFNKTGSYPGLGAYQSKASPYYSWYHFSEFPDKYDAWWGISTLPQVNEQEETYLNYILRDNDSVIKFWLESGASGFRLDVVDELPSEFLRQLRSTLKSIDEDAVLIGEVWENASNKISYGKRRRYFLGEELDSVMNYPVKDALIRYVAYEKSAETLAGVVEELWEDYPWPVFNSLMNTLGTHDTVRILTVLGLTDKINGFSRDEKARLTLSSQEYRLAKDRLYILLMLWVFLPGIPCIYYGDEIGMQGAEDPFNRGCFDSNAGDTEILAYYKELISIRAQIEFIDQYDYRPVLSRNSLYVFSRRFENTIVYIAVNSGNTTEVFYLDSACKGKIKKALVHADASLEADGKAILTGLSGFIAFLQIA